MYVFVLRAQCIYANYAYVRYVTHFFVYALDS